MSELLSYRLMRTSFQPCLVPPLLPQPPPHPAPLQPPPNPLFPPQTLKPPTTTAMVCGLHHLMTTLAQRAWDPKASSSPTGMKLTLLRMAGDRSVTRRMAGTVILSLVRVKLIPFRAAGDSSITRTVAGTRISVPVRTKVNLLRVAWDSLITKRMTGTRTLNLARQCLPASGNNGSTICSSKAGAVLGITLKGMPRAFGSSPRQAGNKTLGRSPKCPSRALGIALKRGHGVSPPSRPATTSPSLELAWSQLGASLLRTPQQV